MAFPSIGWGTSLWPWTWKAWVKVKYGSMANVLEDIGQLMQMGTIVSAAIQEHSEL
jgi:hypothetical protein